MLHELWFEQNGEQTFCLAGAKGDGARSFLCKDAKLVWTCDAGSNFETMTMYYQYMDWGVYTSDFPDEDKRTYAEIGWE